MGMAKKKTASATLKVEPAKPQLGNTGKKEKRMGEPSGQVEVADVPGKSQNKPKKKEKYWVGKNKAESKSSLLDQPCLIHARMDEDGRPSRPTTRLEIVAFS